jgi:mono/diheme cytochrome c family protein
MLARSLLFLVAVIATAAPNSVDFSTVRPVLAKYCFQCHSGQMKMGGLDLSNPTSIFKGGTKGPAVTKGDATKSLLYTRIADGSMPMGGKKLTAEETKAIEQWIRGGAPAAETTAAQTGAAAPHWAFIPPKRPQLPAVTNESWIKTPVDRFVLAQLEQKSIQPVRPAAKLTLLRRVYLDLIGAPPTLAEQEAFLADKSPLAYERVVESLLSRPQYGEPHAWRYRDYVINAFNNDKPYDRFITEQLAGDEIEGSNAETQIATTFLRLGTWDDEPAEPMLDRYDQLDDVVGVTSAALLGVTLRCARCHDHKFEPFTQKDYYRTLAIFQPLKRPQEDRRDLDRLVGTEAELRVYNAAKEKADNQVADLKQKIEGIRKGVLKRLFTPEVKAKYKDSLNFLDHAETVLAFATPPRSRTKDQNALVEKFECKLDDAITLEGTTEERAQLIAHKQEIVAINAARPKEPPRGYIWYEEGSSPPATRLLTRGDPSRPAEEVQPGVPTILGNPDPAAIKPTQQSSGRRLWLARWMTSAENPLLARVMVNRIWQWHFGEGVAPSENDFGVIGQRPTNQPLLDWLATEFRDSGWSLKHMHRLMVLSNTYRLSAEWSESNAAKDPEGVLSWRWKPRRLDAEAVRDMTLEIAGKLNPQMSGPSIYPQLPRAVLEGQSKPGDGWGKSNEAQAFRRSVYIFSKRSLAVPELEVLDAPDTTSSCEQRSTSTTGPQALTFLNGDFTNAQAKNFAARVLAEAPASPRDQVARAFQIALSRKPEPAEIDAALTFLNKQQPGGARGALEQFALVLLNSNEFFYLN